MAQTALGQQLAMVDQFLDHRAIGVAVLAFGGEDAFAGEGRNMRRIGAIRLHQAEGVGILGRVFAVHPQHQLEIVFAMAGRVMDEAGAGIGGERLPAAPAHRSVARLRGCAPPSP
jgi:hypothetical protein